MNIQIFGTKKCRDTQKAERFFRERRIDYHFRDLTEKGVSKGELENISRVVPIEELLDKESKEYSKLNLAYMKFDTETALLEHPLLFITPIVRNGKEVTVGLQQQVWESWIKKG